MRRAIEDEPLDLDYGPPTIGGKLNVMDVSRTDPRFMDAPAWARQEMLINRHDAQAAREAEEWQARRPPLPPHQPPPPDPGDTNPAHYPAYPPAPGYAQAPIEGPAPYFGDYFGVGTQNQFGAPRGPQALQFQPQRPPLRPETTVADASGPRPWTGG